jgi:hypothetical protein
MFDGLELGTQQVALQTIHTLPTPTATHLRYRIRNQPLKTFRAVPHR